MSIIMYENPKISSLGQTQADSTHLHLSKKTFINTKSTWSLFAFCFPALLTTSEVRSQEYLIKALRG